MRYFALRLLSLFYMLLSVVVFIFSTVVFSLIEINAAQFIAAAGMHPTWRAAATLLAIAWLMIGIVISVSLFAAGQFINLMISIETNVREIAAVQDRLFVSSMRPEIPPTSPYQPRRDQRYAAPQPGRWDG